MNVQQEFSANVWRENEWFVAQCLEIDLASRGKTEQEALSNLSEALEVYLEPPLANAFELRQSSRRIAEKYKDAFAEMKRLGD